MNAIETLNRLDDLRRELHFQREKILSLRESARYLSPGYEDVMGGKGPSDRVGKMAAMIADERAELERLEDAYAAAVREAEKVISRLNSPAEREVLVKRYIAGLSWEAAAEKMERSKNRIYQIKNAALRRLANPYEEPERIEELQMKEH